jgi:general secretion pathway protein B
VPTLAELPASLRAELPAMAVTVHAYSPTPKERLLGVNNRLLREGDTLTPELVLERITPDGVILSYKGTRFQRGLR